MAKSLSEGYKAAFKEAFPDIVQELTKDGIRDSEIADGMQHLQRVSGKFCPPGSNFFFFSNRL